LEAELGRETCECANLKQEATRFKCTFDSFHNMGGFNFDGKMKAGG